MNLLPPAALLLLSLSFTNAQAEPAVPIGPLAQSFYPAEDDGRPELFLPEPGDSDASNFLPTPGDSEPSNFLPEEGDSEPDNFESLELDEFAQPARTSNRARA